MWKHARLSLPRLSPTRYYSQDARKCGSRERTSVCACTRVDLRFKRSKRNCRISRLHNSRFDTSWHFIFDSFTRAYTCLRWGPLRNWYCSIKPFHPRLSIISRHLNTYLLNSCSISPQNYILFHFPTKLHYINQQISKDQIKFLSLKLLNTTLALSQQNPCGCHFLNNVLIKIISQWNLMYIKYEYQ